VRGEKFRGEVRGRFFTQLVLNVWNALPEVVVGVGTMVRWDWRDREGLSLGRIP